MTDKFHLDPNTFQTVEVGQRLGGIRNGVPSYYYFWYGKECSKGEWDRKVNIYKRNNRLPMDIKPSLITEE